MRHIILANYKNGTPKKLRKGIPGSKVINPYKEKFKWQGGLVINWGTRPDASSLAGCTNYILNTPDAVNRATNKLRTFVNLMEHHVPTLEWTDKLKFAKEWLTEGRSVFGRRLLEGSNGDGIILAVAKDFLANGVLPSDFENCHLWTRNYPKDKEVRIHVFQGETIFYSEKRMVNPERFKTDAGFNSEGLSKPHFWIRSYQNGWVFCQDGVQRHSMAESVARDAVACLGLDFGAVDVFINGKKAVVCEVNTAPGLEGSSLQAYINKFKSLQGK